MWAERYFEAARAKLQEVEEVNARALPAAAALLTDCLAAGHLIYAFGAGHRAMLVMDIFYRRGGSCRYSRSSRRRSCSTSFPSPRPRVGRRRRDGRGRWSASMASRPVTFSIAISTSGRNAAPVDVALRPKRPAPRSSRCTSVPYANSLPASHSSGKRLHETAEVVLDNRATPGDAALALPGLEVRVAPLSTITGWPCSRPSWPRSRPACWREA